MRWVLGLGKECPGQNNSKYALASLRNRRRAGMARFREERGESREIVGESMLRI